MKHFYLLIILFAFGCNTSKKTSEKSSIKSNATTMQGKASKRPHNTQQELLVVLQNPNTTLNAKELITNSGLLWNKIIVDKNSFKVALIKVPENKKDFWVKRLMESGVFKSVKLYSEKELKELIAKEDNTFLSMRKTPCFGDCPTYTLTITNDGKVVFNGIKHTLLEGKHEFILAEKDFETLKNKIQEKKFKTYKTKYDNPNISDLPSTFITYKDKQIQIRLWNEVPSDLINVHEFIEELLLNKKYIQ